MLAYGCREHPVTSGHELSKEISYSYLVIHALSQEHHFLYTGTHDVQEIVLTSATGVYISGAFVERSTATGILAVVYAVTEPDTLRYYLSVPRSFEQQRTSAVFECIPRGKYNVSLFAVEESDLPFNRAATKVRTLSVDQGRNVDCLGN